MGWAALLARVFAADLSGCPACGGRLRIVAALTDLASIRPIWRGWGCRWCLAEGPASDAVRVRRLTSSAIRSLRREPYAGSATITRLVAVCKKERLGTVSQRKRRRGSSVLVVAC